METLVEGVRIKLTTDQVLKIEKEKKKRERCLYSFKKILLVLGFKEVKDQKNSFIHKHKDWYAEIIQHGGWEDVWIVGHGLKSSALFPGGWVYSSPKEIKTEVLKSLSK